MKLASSKLRNCKFFCEEIKIPKFGTKNALSVSFWAKIKKLQLSYLKSALLDSPNCKILRKKENARIRDKNCLIWVFLG